MWVGWQRKENPASWRLASHAELEFQYVREGHCAYFVNGQNYPCLRNTLLLIRPHEPHSFVSAPDRCRSLEKYCVMVQLGFLKEGSKPVRFPATGPRCLVLAEDEATEIELIFRHILNEYQKRPVYWKEILRENLRELVWRFRRLGERPKPLLVASPIVTQLLDHIEANFVQPMPVTSLARTFGYSANHLSLLCRKYTGIGLKQYILRRRIIEAKRLLEAQPSLKMEAIAEKIGFADYSLFSRIFRQVTNMTPSGYRRISHPDN
ncbi:MAG: AraC family transcriptional regulator [Verrucomicrobia bacterium]|nr:AraC family transcriptional regulator [Verrucomicrobiota bacterium]